MQEVIVYSNPLSAFLWKAFMSPNFWVVFSVGLASVMAYYHFSDLINGINSKYLKRALKILVLVVIIAIWILIFKVILK